MNKNGKIALILASIFPLIVLTLGNLQAKFLKSNNVDNVDITQGLAYLRPILIMSFLVLAIFIITTIFFSLRGMKNDEQPEFAKLGLIILIVNLVLFFATNAAINGHNKLIESAWQSKSEQRR